MSPKARDGLAKCLALLGVADCVAKYRAARADTSSTEFEPPDVQDVKGDVMSLAHFAE